MIDCNDKNVRKSVFNNLTKIINGEASFSLDDMKDIEAVMERQEEIIEDQEERIAIMTEGGWHDASKRPPKERRYLVWGLHEFTPDHCDMPNAYWQTRIAQWSNITGWDTKVKYWQDLPEPPKGVET